MTQVRRLGSAAGAFALLAATVATTVLVIAAPAHAQGLGVDLPLPEGPVPGGVVEGPNDAVDGAGGTIDDVVDDVTDTVGGAVEDAGDTAGGAVADAGDKVGTAAGGDAGKKIKEATGSASSGMKAATKTVAEALGGAGKTVKETASGVTGSSQGGFKGTNPGGGGVDVDPITSGKPFVGPGEFSAASIGGGSSQGGLTSGFTAGSSGSAAFANAFDTFSIGPSDELVGAAAEARAPVDLNQFVQEAIEAVRQFAFPLALTILVVTYMVIQGRIDRQDPKLTVASVDGEQDLLSFS